MEMIKDMWSVIVPVYNVEKYLEECVESILAQDYRPMEIILIDDGSPDQSGEICDRYAVRYPDIIRVVHKENGGLSSARNAGLDVARGEFIAFIDSDDKILPGMGTDSVHAMVSCDADVVCSSFLPSDERVKVIAPPPTDRDITGLEALEMLFDSKIDRSSCTKIYRHSLIGDTRFPVGVTNEDFPFLCDILLKAARVHILPRGYYFYRVTNGSISRTFGPKFFDMFANIDAVRATLPGGSPGLERAFVRNELRTNIFSGVRIVQNRKNRQYKKWLRRNRSFILGHLRTLLFDKRISKREVLKAGFAFMHLPFTVKVRS